MKIRVNYVRGLQGMKIINAETGEEVGVIVAKDSLSKGDKTDLLDTVAWLIGEEE